MSFRREGFAKRSAGAFFAGLSLIVCNEAVAQYRVVVEPSITIMEVHDDNLFLSDQAPVRDLLLRARPGLALTFESPRVAIAGKYGFDSERFATYSGLNNARARESASIGMQYQATPRLAVTLDGSYADTDTAAELNLLTGLAASRVRVQRLAFGPTARFRISPRLTARASYLSTTDKLFDGTGVRSQVQTVGIEQRVSPRDWFTFDSERSTYVFHPSTVTSTTNSYVLRSAWTRALTATTHLMVQAGPRFTDHSTRPELAASFTQDWELSSITISGLQTQTTAIGHVGIVEARSLQARFTCTPSRSLTAYAAPAVIRSIQSDFRATVYRIGIGAHYAMTSLTGFDVAYNRDSQHGAIDAFHPNGRISRSTLVVGVTARWIAPDRLGTGRR